MAQSPITSSSDKNNAVANKSKHINIVDSFNIGIVANPNINNTIATSLFFNVSIYSNSFLSL